ncbi:MAG: DUF1015 domain-containing protein [Capsulimonadaceae bacterium]|nr:DUF1015 domain-containing protein [Capsulimonadaceae bacterium]
MAEIRPFRGVRYNPDVIGRFEDVVAPPYDVLSAAQVHEYHARHPHNITHLTRPAGEEPYANAAKLWREWLASGALAVDPEPALYIYQQSFTDPETGLPQPERLGLICALKLEDYSSGKVVPHENTITAHRADRLRLLRATQANFESIYGLYSDPDREVEQFINEFAGREPVIENVGNVAGSTHRLERITNEEAIGVIANLLREKPVFIADGHHRYETSLAYRAEAGGNPEADYIVITLTAFEDEGLLVLPTHRLVKNVAPGKLAALPDHLARAGFDVLPVSTASLVGKTPDAYGFFMVLGDQAYDVRPRDREALVASIPQFGSHALRSLNVIILSAIALEQGLDIPIASLATTDKVTYTRDAGEALDKVQRGDSQAAFLLARPTVEQVQDVAAEGEKMPQKSTFFFPKLLSGLVMRDLRVEG